MNSIFCPSSEDSRHCHRLEQLISLAKCCNTVTLAQFSNTSENFFYHTSYRPYLSKPTNLLTWEIELIKFHESLVKIKKKQTIIDNAPSIILHSRFWNALLLSTNQKTGNSLPDLILRARTKNSSLDGPRVYTIGFT